MLQRNNSLNWRALPCKHHAQGTQQAEHRVSHWPPCFWKKEQVMHSAKEVYRLQRVEKTILPFIYFCKSSRSYKNLLFPGLIILSLVTCL